MSRGAARHRWRATHVDARNREEQRANYVRGAAHLTLAAWASRCRWTKHDEKVVLDHVLPDRVLAVLLHRSVKAIRAHRAALVRRRRP